MDNTRELPKYLISVRKVTAMTGEEIHIQANLPDGGDVESEVRRLTSAIDARMEAVNRDLLERTNGKYSLKDADMAAAAGIPLDEFMAANGSGRKDN